MYCKAEPIDPLCVFYPPRLPFSSPNARQVLLYYYDSQVLEQQAQGSVAGAALAHWLTQARETVSTALTPQI